MTSRPYAEYACTWSCEVIIEEAESIYTDSYTYFPWQVHLQYFAHICSPVGMAASTVRAYSQIIMVNSLDYLILGFRSTGIACKLQLSLHS